MKALIFLPLIFISCFIVKAQTSPFGQIDVADLKLKEYSNEKNADAMILFDVGRITYSDWDGVVMTRHERIKIFNERGLAAADLKVIYPADSRFGNIKDLEAITYNLVGDEVEKVVINKKEFYTQKIDKSTRQIVIPFPKVKAGSVIEFRYKWKSYYYPIWKFQHDLPIKYSEFDVLLRSNRAIINVNRQFVKDSTYKTEEGMRHIWALKDVPGFKLEPYMHSVEDNLQYVSFHKPNGLYSWELLVNNMMADEDFGKQLNLPLDKEKEIIQHAIAEKTDIAKIEYLFNTVKNTVKWNKNERWYTEAGVKKAWLSKSGNSAEINLILFHLLKAAGLSPALAVAGSRETAEIKVEDPSYSRLNKTVIQMALDSTHYLMLDAASKYNAYNFTPLDLIGQNILVINHAKGSINVVRLQNNYQSEEVTFINAAIAADGKVEGSTQHSSSFYKKVDKMQLFDDLGEKSYIDDIKAGVKNLNISNFKRYGMETDTLPLREDFDFKLDLAEVDGEYIYFNPNLFTGIAVNPFVSEERLSDVDFVYLNRYNINGHYKLPAGYKVEALPKQISLAMEDNSINFSRLVGELNGDVVVHYVIKFNTATFKREGYGALRKFYKKMFELLNEQIVLKKVS